MKKIMILLLAFVLGLSLAGCEYREIVEANEDGDKIYFQIKNDGLAVVGFGLTYYLAEEAFASIGMKEASGHKISDGLVEFILMKEDIPKDADLRQFGLEFMVTEENGVEYPVDIKYFPVQFGNTYSFRLTNENDSYVVVEETERSKA